MADTKIKESTRQKFREAARTNSGNIHIIYSNNEWAVKREGAKRAAYKFKSKQEAIKKARKHSAYSGKIIIHTKDGTVDHYTR